MAPRLPSVTTVLSTALLTATLAGTSALAEKEIDLASFDLEDLIEMEVTSVSKKAERAFEAPAAAFVITSEDISRSSARTIPELLRMVPGVQVAHVAHNQYAISVRGFNGSFSDKLLVLIDGRTVYTPLFAGVFWDIQETPLADIDRIEVIRGPGGTVWGANAVNGVINIVTKEASDTQGWLVEGGIGNYERAGSGVVRYGGSLPGQVDFRLYLKHFAREDFPNRKGEPDANDRYDQLRTGIRMDGKLGDAGEFTLQGDLHDGTVNSFSSGAKSISEVGGGNVLARYTHNFSEDHNVSVQFYYDRTDRNATILRYELDTFDIELKHQIAPLPWLDVVWGGEYRHLNDDSKTRLPAGFDATGLLAGLGFDAAVSLNPTERKLDLFSGFVQVEGRAFEDQVRLTLGTKLEDNDTSGFEVQPSARIAYVPTASMTVWASVARAVRTPSRVNLDVTTLGATDALTPLQNEANPDIEAEDLLAYEGGVRLQPIDWLHLDLAGFYSVYNDLIIQDSIPSSLRFFDPPGPIPLTPGFDRIGANNGEAVAWGIEFFARAELLEDIGAVEKWWVDVTYAYLDVDVDRDGGTGIDAILAGSLGDDDFDTRAKGSTEAHHTVGLRSHWDLAFDLAFDLSYYYVSEIKDVTDDEVDAYHKVDIRTTWRPTPHVEASFSVENLFEGEHAEWNTEAFVTSNNVPRTFYGKLTLEF